jgi:coproporphyrinogen III oxidase
MYDRAAALFQSLQSDICKALEAFEPTARFREDKWNRPGGGGGATRVLEGGAVFEKAGVNWSGVHGDLPEIIAKEFPGSGREFFATGVSLVLHPRSPMVPTTHANFRYFERGSDAWFGGGADLTPYYLFKEDVIHFHRELKGACDRHSTVADYARFKKQCDEYFFLPHRGETRGVGGLFFDYIRDQPEEMLAFVGDCGRTFTKAYCPIVEKRKDAPYGEAERTWQLRRRGRYVEFNLCYDRGTTFGLKTGGRTESILMSLPPEVRWDYDVSPDPNSREADLCASLRAIDWL